MNDQISLINIILNSNWLVLVVLVVLVLASVLSWVVIIQRWLLLRTSEQNYQEFDKLFWSGVNLSELYNSINLKESAIGLTAVFCAGFEEFKKVYTQEYKINNVPAQLESIQRSMRVTITRERERLEKHFTFLASVGSVTPYIGLFGTVIGIMSAFFGLTQTHETTLAAVAPGIAEALFATAVGLFAAIPALLAYNRYLTQSEKLLNHYETFAEEFTNILCRKLHN